MHFRSLDPSSTVPSTWSTSTSSNDVTKRWQVVPHLLLRRAGFPLGLLQGLACPESAGLATRLASERVRAEGLRRTLLGDLFSQEVKRLAEAGDRAALKRISRWRRTVGTRHGVAAPADVGSEPLRRCHA